MRKTLKCYNLPSRLEKFITHAEHTHTVIEHINYKVNLFTIIISLMELYDGGNTFLQNPNLLGRSAFLIPQNSQGAGLRTLIGGARWRRSWPRPPHLCQQTCLFPFLENQFNLFGSFGKWSSGRETKRPRNIKYTVEQGFVFF